MQNLKALLDSMEESIYLASCDSYNLLYVNPAAQALYGVGPNACGKCYKVLRGRAEPCVFCTMHLLRQDQFYKWEYREPMTGRIYLLRDKCVQWEGERARLELALDVTDARQQTVTLQNAINNEGMLLECVAMLHGASDVQAAVFDCLAKMGRFLEASRAYLYEFQGESVRRAVEWFAPGMCAKPRQELDVDAETLQRWIDSFRHQESVICENVRELAEEDGRNAEIVQTLLARGVHTVAVAALTLGDRVAGFIGLDNPPACKLQNIGPMLVTLSHFVALSLQKQETREQLERRSYLDELTGARNRNAFLNDSAAIERQGGPVGVVYLDVNGMKEINDARGHWAGDRILIQVAARARAYFPEENFYRVGGDEFVLFCRSGHEREFEEMVNRMRVSFRNDPDCKIALGYRWGPDASALQRLLMEADERMYEDKRKFYRGRGGSARYRHGSDDILGLTRPGVLERELERGRFHVVFQPKMTLEPDGKLLGAEVLARYHLPSGACILPDQFIPVLEEARLVQKVDLFSFESACAQLSAWRETGWPLLPLSVNFSRYTLTDSGLFPRLEQLRARYQVPKGYLQIEATESYRLEDREEMYQILRTLRQGGYPVAIDDFGAENANMALFALCDFDELKVDKSLIAHLADNPKAQVVVRAIERMCRETGVLLIYEGVETLAQHTYLHASGGEGAQGFLYSKPLEIGALEDFMRAHGFGPGERRAGRATNEK